MWRHNNRSYCIEKGHQKVDKTCKLVLRILICTLRLEKADSRYRVTTINYQQQ